MGDELFSQTSWKDAAEEFHRRFTVSSGVVEVPVDYDRPDGEKIGLTLVRVRSRKAHDSLGPLLVGAGGLGGAGASGLWEAPYTAWETPEPMSERFDFVSFDQRGVGCSGQVGCWAQDARRQIGLPPDLRAPGAVAEAARAYRAVDQRCADRLGARLAHYSTYEAAQDLESIRLALGAERITYLGYSYGGFLGAVYAHLHPQSLRAAVLDSPVDFTRPMAQYWEEKARGWEGAFSEFLDWAARRPAFGLPPEAKGQLAELAGKGYQIAGQVPNFYGNLGARANWPQLAHDLRAGLLGAAAPQRDAEPRAPEAFEPAAQWESTYIVRCDDESPGSRVGEPAAAAFAAEWPRRYPLLGTAVLNWSGSTLLGCAGWPEPAHPAAPRMLDATGSPPILVVSGLRDPEAPHSIAEPFAAALRTGVLLSAQRPGHEQYLINHRRADGCLNTAVDDYLLDGKIPAPGTVCADDE